MRIPKTWVPLIAKKVIDDVLAKGLVEAVVPKEQLVADTERIIMEELMVEDRVNNEVREILKKFSSEIEKGRLDYRKVFDLTKKKIVEERGLIL
ncbi:MAG TPA: DUF507 family protein [Thermodesulfovibrionales bacterium]|jgi:hypothetical protein|nr:DUF507 family protein [Thermodesulfovibrionales bacterium]